MTDMQMYFIVGALYAVAAAFCKDEFILFSLWIFTSMVWNFSGLVTGIVKLYGN